MWAREFGNIARELKQISGSAAILHRIAELATQLASCPWAAIARATDKRPVVAATSDPAIAQRIAEMQALAGGGPTWHAVRTGERVYVADLTRETRWPAHVSELLARTPVRSIVAFSLQFGDETLGALTLYGDRPDAFSSEALETASVYADQAALALEIERTAERAENLEAALRTSREIGVAIGILVERYKISTQQSFEMLRVASQERHRKLRDIAADIVLTGEFDRRDDAKPDPEKIA
jgi:GAF domain-containing protein